MNLGAKWLLEKKINFTPCRSIETNFRHTARIGFSNVVLLRSDDENEDDKC